MASSDASTKRIGWFSAIRPVSLAFCALAPSAKATRETAPSRALRTVRGMDVLKRNDFDMEPPETFIL